LKLIIFLD